MTKMIIYILCVSFALQATGPGIVALRSDIQRLFENINDREDHVYPESFDFSTMAENHLTVVKQSLEYVFRNDPVVWRQGSYEHRAFETLTPSNQQILMAISHHIEIVPDIMHR